MLFDPDANPVAITVEQNRDHEKSAAARDDRQDDKQPDVEVGKARGDGDEFVGSWRQSLQQNDPRAIFGVARAESLDLVAKPIELDQPLSERVVKQRADGITEDAAQHRSR